MEEEDEDEDDPGCTFHPRRLHRTANRRLPMTVVLKKRNPSVDSDGALAFHIRRRDGVVAMRGCKKCCWLHLHACQFRARQATNSTVTHLEVR